jgi:putative membrane protein
MTAPLAYAQGGTGQAAGATQPQGAKAQGKPQAGSAGDQTFARQMMMINMAEIELGKMASEKASNSDVKAFAQMMVTHHSDANKELMALATGQSAQQPTELDAKHKAVAQRLSKLSGDEFDRQYMQAMVTSHRETVARVKPRAGAAGKSAGSGTGAATGTAGTGGTGAGTSGADAGANTIPQYAAKTLPIVQKHLQEAERLHKTMMKGGKTAK